MQVNLRRERRTPTRGVYAMTWQNAAGTACSVEGTGTEISPLGVGIHSPAELRPGTIVHINGPGGVPHGSGIVRHCTRSGAGYLVGLEFGDDAKQSMAREREDSTDYYEFLQISPKAEAATIHRVYRFLAAQYHPDNPQTGNTDNFVLLNRIYRVLSDPQQRAAYDASRQQSEPPTIGEPSEFVDGIDGEINRRLAILALLYNKRRTNSQEPSISLWDLERRMSMPREFLDFATWYLKNKGYITVADNSDFALTAAGVDYVEGNAGRDPMLHKLLAAGGIAPRTEASAEPVARPRTPYRLEPHYMEGARGVETNGHVNGAASRKTAAAAISAPDTIGGVEAEGQR